VKWALVTGASTGIGRAITEKLAKQGINVVLVALDDQFLKDFFKKIQADYPTLKFRSIGVDLGKDGYMNSIVENTADIPINLVFNNAGFITVGLFQCLDLDRQLKNMEVNQVCAVKITHHFLNLMVQNGMKGAIVFTSSPAGYLVSPGSVLYASTKAFVTQFAISLAIESKADGIDILAVHPSPVDTNFYKADTIHKSDMINLFKKTVTPPTTIANVMFSSVGRVVVVDQGATSFIFKLLLKLCDIGIFSFICTRIFHITGDYKNLIKDRNLIKEKKTKSN